MQRKPAARAGVPIGRTARIVYGVLTAAFLVAAVGFAAAQLWIVAVACLLMGGAMTGASRQMVDRHAPSGSTRPGTGRTDPRD
ncbi:MAG: hypothetical protein PGN13_12680 [Patulibacter minatonensis]